MAGTSYTRQSTIADGNLISASLFNSEYNQIVNAFAYNTTGTTGHTHDGSAGQGGAIAKIGDQDFKNKIEVSATNNRIEFYSEVGGSPVEQVRIQDGAIVPVTDSDVDLGTTSVRFKDAYIDSVTVTNNIVVAGTVDGRDVATDGTKLDGIEASATADQTDAEIRAAVEAATDSNVFTDADHTKLNAIEAGADVTDTTNVTAAGALMDSEVTNLAQVKAFDSSDYATAAQGTKADAALPTTGGAMTGAITTNSTFDGRDVAADGTKLDGIEASADVTDTTNVVAALSAGTGISLSAGGEIANTAPDQTVALTGSGGTTVSGTYPNFTISSSAAGYSLPVATDTVLGGIELFSNTDQSVAANAVTTTASRTYGIQLNSDNQAVVNVPWTNTTYTVGDGGLTEINFTSADNAKLDGIEANADITDTSNVTAAGALMDSEVTNLAQVKAFDSADYATAAQGVNADAALPLAGGALTGAVTTNSTFDGRDVATDGTKLDGIEASADVTDTANVTAAGALMDSELTSEASVKALDQGVATTDSPTFAAINVNGLVTSDDFQIDLGTTTAFAQITTPSNLSGFQAFSIKNTHTEGYLTFGTVNGEARIQALGASGTADPLKIDVGTTTAIKIDDTGVVRLRQGIAENKTNLTGTTTTINLNSATNFAHDLTGNTTYTFSNPPVSGEAKAFTLKIIQDSTARTITWPSSVDWAGGTAPTLSTANNAVDVFVFYTIDNGTTYYGFTAGQAMA